MPRDFYALSHEQQTRNIKVAREILRAPRKTRKWVRHYLKRYLGSRSRDFHQTEHRPPMLPVQFVPIGTAGNPAQTKLAGQQALTIVRGPDAPSAALPRPEDAGPAGPDEAGPPRPEDANVPREETQTRFADSLLRLENGSNPLR